MGSRPDGKRQYLFGIGQKVCYDWIQDEKHTSVIMMNTNLIFKMLLPIIVGFLVYMCPMPEGIDPKGWKLLAIFIGTVVSLISRPFPMGALALMSLGICLLTDTLTLEGEALTGYSSSVVWLVVYVFFIAKGFIKTQLGARVAFFVVRLFGKHSLGLGYSVAVTELLIAPLIPSSTARAGGVIYPVVHSVSEALGSHPREESSRRIGSFLNLVAYHVNLITSAMFLTGMAANPMMQSFAAAQGIEITWTNWALGGILPGLLSLAIVPWVIYTLYPPRLRHFDHAVEIANAKLRDLGPMSQAEWIMTGIFMIMLFLWMGGESYGIKSTTTALIGLCLLLLCRVVTWDDLLSEKEAWHTLIWFGILIILAKYLQVFGVVAWISHLVSLQVEGMEWPWAFGVLILIYYYSHYFFASNTSHISAMYAAFLAVALSVGTPPLMAALALGFCSSLFSATTHYGASGAAVFYGAGYVPVGPWWGLGFVISLVHLTIWFGLGPFWWRLVGIW